MSLCIPTYMIASSLIEGGMNWWQAILTVFLGNAIVVIPMVLNGDAGARYGINFPVFSRASFGVLGANIPAMLRAIVACGWFVYQSQVLKQESIERQQRLELNAKNELANKNL